MPEHLACRDMLTPLPKIPFGYGHWPFGRLHWVSALPGQLQVTLTGGSVHRLYNTPTSDYTSVLIQAHRV